MNKWSLAALMISIFAFIISVVVTVLVIVYRAESSDKTIEGTTAAQIAEANSKALESAASALEAGIQATAAGLSANEAAAYVAGINNNTVRNNGTGVVSDYTVTAPIGGTFFTISALSGSIHSRIADVIIDYAGEENVTVKNLNVASTYVYLDTTGVLNQQISAPTREEWSQKIYLVRISVSTVGGYIVGFEYLSNTIGHFANTIRDFYNTLLAQGIPFKLDQTITGNAGNLKWNTSAGKAFELGGSGDIHDPNFKVFDAVENSEYYLMERTGVGTSGHTDLVKFWDNSSAILPLGSGTFVAHRLYRFSSSTFVIQYGQGNYANIALAKVGALLEEYVLNPRLQNATFFGWWLIGQTATNTLGVDGLTAFKEYTIGIQGGSSGALSGAIQKVNNGSDFPDPPTVLINLGVPAAIADSTIGVSQTWQSVSGSRASDLTVYQNTTGKPIQVNIMYNGNSSSSATFMVSSDNVTWYIIYFDNGDGAPAPMTGVIIPTGHYYRSQTTGGDNDPDWFELR